MATTRHGSPARHSAPGYTARMDWTSRAKWGPWGPRWLAIVGVACVSGCGPTREQIAVAGLVALPIGLIFGMLGVLALRRLWGDAASLSPGGWAIAIVGLVVSIALTSSPHFDLELAVPVAAYVSGAVVGLSLFGARLRLGAPAERSAVLTPLVIVGLLALPFAQVLVGVFEHEREAMVLAGGVWAVLGAALATPLVAIGLVIEWIVVSRRAGARRRGESTS